MISAPSSTQLPVVPRPARDERLSSWLNRLARFYAMPIDAFLEHCGLNCKDATVLEWRLGEEEGAILASRTGLTIEALRTMTFEEIAPHARLTVARGSRYVCRSCSSGIHRKRAAFPWNFWCREHDLRLDACGGRKLGEWLPEPALALLDFSASDGAARLTDWAHGRDDGVPSIPQRLDFLTTRHRRSSPPSLAEQPILSLAARRANHDFLSRPIARQALLIIVPEYDRVAPVLAKPVRAALSADPVGYVASVLLASDGEEEGEQRLRQALQGWPLALRRRIYGRFQRLNGMRAQSGRGTGAVSEIPIHPVSY
ncbi:TniQ family protein [Sinorhizobium medicae]|uniref:TniQ family protein n=1 Tax=Sinorhizobium medicae TaxID=110321 RepID=UPI002B1BDCEE|nr:TniQ family protein [Sinorhizobium medicae]WQO48356.1 TniQ family protein [Sinorhizobium medicae]